MQRTTEEITEIERHKYFLSEKQGHDVGWDFAEQDWEANFADKWRRDQSQHTNGNGHNGATPIVKVIEEESTVVADNSPAETLRVDPSLPDGRGRGPLMRLFSKLFSKSS